MKLSNHKTANISSDSYRLPTETITHEGLSHMDSNLFDIFEPANFDSSQPTASTDISSHVKPNSINDLDEITPPRIKTDVQKSTSDQPNSENLKQKNSEKHSGDISKKELARIL